MNIGPNPPNFYAKLYIKDKKIRQLKNIYFFPVQFPLSVVWEWGCGSGGALSLSLCRFGFVQFNSYFSAFNAMLALNGTEVKGRKVTVDMVVPKTDYQIIAGRKEEEVEERIELERENTMDDIDEEDFESTGGERMDIEDDHESHSGESMDADGVADDERDKEMVVSESEISSSDKEEEEGGQRSSERYKQDLDEGRTVFIRFAWEAKISHIDKVMIFEKIMKSLTDAIFWPATRAV